MEQLNNKTLRLSKHHMAIVGLILANLIWGAASPIFKWSLEDIEPFTLAFLRFFIGALIILPFTLHKLHVSRHDFVRLLLITLTGVTIGISFYFLGLQKTASVNAPIIASASPVIIIIGSILLLGERPKKRVLLGTFLSLIGVLSIIIEPMIETGLDASVIGNLFLIASALGGILHTILLKEFTKKYTSLTITFWSFLLGSFTFLPMVAVEVQNHGFLTNLNMQGLIGIIFGAVLCSALAYYLFALALKYVVVSEASIFTYMNPIVAILIAIPLLGEKITPIFVVGSALVFIGILVAEKRFPWHPLDKLRLKELARVDTNTV